MFYWFFYSKKCRLHQIIAYVFGSILVHLNFIHRGEVYALTCFRALTLGAPVVEMLSS